MVIRHATKDATPNIYHIGREVIIKHMLYLGDGVSIKILSGAPTTTKYDLPEELGNRAAVVRSV